MNSTTLFGVWPYVAVAVAVAGFILRFALLRRAGAGWREAAEASQADHDDWGLLGGRTILRAALALLVLAHVVALAAPQLMLRVTASPGGLYALEGAGFLLGALALLGALGGIRRHLGASRVPPPAQLADAAFLSALTVSLVTGLVVAARYRWAAQWSAGTVAPYVQSVVRGQPAPSLVAQAPLLLQLHVVAALAAIALLPLSRVGSALVVVAGRAGAVAARPLAAAGQAMQARARRFSLASWIWPEEDLLDIPPVGARYAAGGGGKDGGGGGGGTLSHAQARGRVADGSVLPNGDPDRPSFPAQGGG